MYPRKLESYGHVSALKSHQESQTPELVRCTRPREGVAPLPGPMKKRTLNTVVAMGHWPVVCYLVGVTRDQEAESIWPFQRLTQMHCPAHCLPGAGPTLSLWLFYGFQDSISYLCTSTRTWDLAEACVPVASRCRDVSSKTSTIWLNALFPGHPLGCPMSLLCLPLR